MDETGHTPNIPEIETNNWVEMAEAKIDEANDRYNNLFRCIEIGGVPLGLSLARQIEEPDDELIRLMSGSEKLAEAMQTAMSEIGITSLEVDRFVQLREDLNTLTEEQYNEIVEYIDKVEKVYQFLSDHGFTHHEIIK